MSWYIALSLEVLRKQLNIMAPNRSKISDGGIGDAAHSARYSDHNPTSSGQVCARDFTHDPAGGLDCHWLAERLVASGDTRIKYIIWNRRIWDRRTGWQPYSGDNPHTKHLHLSVWAGGIGDLSTPWNIGGGGASPGQENDMQLSDTFKAWDGTTVTVAQALAGILGRVVDVRDAHFGDAEKGSGTGNDAFGAYVFTDNPGQPGERKIRTRDLLAELRDGARQAQRIDEIETKLDKVLAALNKLNEGTTS